MPWSEDRLHRWIADRLAPERLAGSVGHDAAVLRSTAGSRPVLCVDHTVESIHFATGTAPRVVGRKAADRVLSDLAATAATPRALLVGLSAPAATSEAWLRGVLSGVATRASNFGAELVGGDLCCSPGPIALAVTGVGELPGRRRPPGRDRARAKQHLFLTGPVGGSRRSRQLAIEPRIEAGRELWEAGASALMDVSDGLAFDLYRMARSAGVGMELELDAIPIHADARRAARRSGRSALDHALHDGEDHELLATGPRALEMLSGANWRAHRIGRVTSGRGLWLKGDGERTAWSLKQGGWRHGRT